MGKQLLNIISSFFFIFQIYNAQQSEWTTYNYDNSNIPGHDIVSIINADPTNIWIGFYGRGLSKFDGLNWTMYNTSNSDIPGNDVSSIVMDKNGNLWVGTWSKGLAYFDGINWTVYNKTNSELPDNDINGLVIDEYETLWIGTYGGGLANFDGKTWQVFNKYNSKIPDNYILSLTLDENQNLWIGIFDYFSGFAGGLVKYNYSPTIPDYYQDENWTLYNKENSGLPHNRVKAIKVDKLGNIWIGTWGGGLAKFDGESWNTFNSINSQLPSDDVRSIEITDENKIWIGTSGGLVKIENSMMVFNTSNSGLPGNDILSLSFQNNYIWIGTWGNGLAKYSPSAEKRGVITQHFRKGWNMFGIPLLPQNNHVDSLYPNAIKNSSFMWDWSEGRYKNIYLFEVGKGYWLKFDYPDTVFFEGDLVDSVVVNLPSQDKWNIISGVSDNVAVTNIIDTSDIIKLPLFYWNGTNYVDVDTLFPGKSYWLRNSFGGDIILSPYTKKIAKQIDKIVFEKFPHIELSDKNGIIFKLYLNIPVNSKYHFYFPPPPPDVKFYASFDGNYYALHENRGIINLISQNYPIKLTAINSNLQIKLNDEYLINLKENNSYIIEEESIKSIKVEAPKQDSQSVSLNDFHLSQNYPNPFNPKTIIQFILPSENNVDLKIYNNIGELITTLLNKRLSSGYHKVEFDGTDFTSGIYYYRLTAKNLDSKHISGYTSTRKMILLK